MAYKTGNNRSQYKIIKKQNLWNIKEYIMGFQTSQITCWKKIKFTVIPVLM